MEKVITISDRRVKDIAGLFYDLRKGGFLVRNVGSDQCGTYVHLEADEEKDPTALVELWLERPAPTVTRKMLSERKSEAKKAEEAARISSMAAASARASREFAEAQAAQAAQAIDSAQYFDGNPSPLPLTYQEPVPVPVAAQPQKSFLSTLVKRLVKTLW